MSKATPARIHLLASKSSVSICKLAVNTYVAPLALVTYAGQSYYPIFFFSFFFTDITLTTGSFGCKSLSLASVKYPSAPALVSQAAPSRYNP